MPRSKTIKYGLYQTFISNSKNEKNLPAKDLEKLSSRLKDLDRDKTEAVFMLICEHARISGDFDYDSENIVLPYEMKDEDGEISLDIKTLPKELQRILLKFSNVILDR